MSKGVKKGWAKIQPNRVVIYALFFFVILVHPASLEPFSKRS